MIEIEIIKNTIKTLNSSTEILDFLMREEIKYTYFKNDLILNFIKQENEKYEKIYDEELFNQMNDYKNFINDTISIYSIDENIRFLNFHLDEFKTDDGNGSLNEDDEVIIFLKSLLRKEKIKKLLNGV